MFLFSEIKLAVVSVIALEGVSRTLKCTRPGVDFTQRNFEFVRVCYE